VRRTELVTLDMTAIRDVVEDGRAQHTEALKLLALAERGEVELGIPPQGSLADLRGQFGGELAQQIRALLTRPGVVELPQIARLSDVTFPSPTLWPGHYIEGFGGAWDAVANHWKTDQGRCPGSFDRWYVESHILGGRDVIVTDDRALRAMCDRLRDEHGLAVQAESLLDFVARHGRARK
jgi:hypothetical protein